MKNPSPESQAQDKLKTLQSQIDQKTNQLSHLGTELKTAQLRQKQLKSSLEAETERLVKYREQELGATEEGWRERISPLEARVGEVKALMKQQQLELEQVRSAIVGAEAELNKHKDSLTIIQAQTQTERNNVAIYEGKLSGLKAQVSTVSADIGPLHVEKLELTEVVKGLEARKASLQQERDDTYKAYQAEKLERERTLHNLESRAQEVSLKIDRDMAIADQTRQELATRETKLNKLQEVLERRELKVARDERSLAQNADLMNL